MQEMSKRRNRVFRSDIRGLERFRKCCLKLTEVKPSCEALNYFQAEKYRDWLTVLIVLFGPQYRKIPAQFL